MTRGTGNRQGKEMEMARTRTVYDEPPLWISDKALQLLANAEGLVYDNDCTNHCVHHREGVFCGECPHFVPASNGYVACDGYAQAGEGAVA